MDLVCIFSHGTMNSMWSEIKGWAGSKAHMGYRKLRTMGVREVCGRDIVFERQICKPLEQLVSSFHWEKKQNNKQHTSACFQDVCFLQMAVSPLMFLCYIGFLPEASLLASLILCTLCALCYLLQPTVCLRAVWTLALSYWREVEEPCGAGKAIMMIFTVSDNEC